MEGFGNMKKIEIALLAAFIFTLLFPEISLKPAQPKTPLPAHKSDIVVSEQVTFKFKIIELFEQWFE